MNVNGPYYHYNQYISNVSINDKQIIQFVSILNSRSVFWFKIRKKSHSVKTNEILLLLYLINKCRLGPMKLSWLRCPLTPNIKVLSESCLLSFFKNFCQVLIFWVSFSSRISSITCQNIQQDNCEQWKYHAKPDFIHVTCQPGLLLGRLISE